MCLEHRCEGRLPNGEVGELITGQIKKGLVCQMKGFESDREGSREPFIKQSYMKLKTGAKKEKKTKRKMATSALFNVIIS